MASHILRVRDDAPGDPGILMSLFDFATRVATAEPSALVGLWNLKKIWGRGELVCSLEADINTAGPRVVDALELLKLLRSHAETVVEEAHFERFEATDSFGRCDSTYLYMSGEVETLRRLANHFSDCEIVMLETSSF